MIYLDYNATTPLSESVKKSITENLDAFLNPSSMYKESEIVKNEIKKSRCSIAKLINANPEQIIFTGCATESNNTVLSTCIDSAVNGENHIVISSVEHSAVLETAKYYQKYRGVDVTFVPVDENGRIDVKDIERAITSKTTLVSVMMVNNEIGNVYPIKEIAEIAHKKNPNIKVHTDATQAIGKMKVDVQELEVDYLTVSGHKFYAPKGVGALYIRKNAGFIPFMRGGHQENSLRAGTENLISIIALGQAAKEILEFKDFEGMRKKRDQFEKNVLNFIKGSKILGDVGNRVCNTSCILVDKLNGIDICEIVNTTDDICISSGSACNSVILEPSHVMKAMGIQQIPIRVSIGKETTEKELTKCLQALIKAQKILNK